jgi:hypothetical protein
MLLLDSFRAGHSLFDLIRKNFSHRNNLINGQELFLVWLFRINQTYNPGKTQRTVHNKIPMKSENKKVFALDAIDTLSLCSCIRKLD